MDETEARADQVIITHQTYPDRIKVTGGLEVKSPGAKPYSSITVSAYVSREYSAEVDIHSVEEEVTTGVIDTYGKIVTKYRAEQKKSNE